MDCREFPRLWESYCVGRSPLNAELNLIGSLCRQYIRTDSSTLVAANVPKKQFFYLTVFLRKFTFSNLLSMAAMKRMVGLAAKDDAELLR